jgi:hypothetical protein
LQFIRDRHLGRVDCFVYGDTHRAGIFQRRNGPLAVNSGCFTREIEGRSITAKPGSLSPGFSPKMGGGSSPAAFLSGRETPETYLLLDDWGLALRQLGQDKPLFLCELF